MDCQRLPLLVLKLTFYLKLWLVLSRKVNYGRCRTCGLGIILVPIQGSHLELLAYSLSKAS